MKPFEDVEGVVYFTRSLCKAAIHPGVNQTLEKVKKQGGRSSSVKQTIKAKQNFTVNSISTSHRNRRWHSFIICWTLSFLITEKNNLTRLFVSFPSCKWVGHCCITLRLNVNMENYLFSKIFLKTFQELHLKLLAVHYRRIKEIWVKWIFQLICGRSYQCVFGRILKKCLELKKRCKREVKKRC